MNCSLHLYTSKQRNTTSSRLSFSKEKSSSNAHDHDPYSIEAILSQNKTGSTIVQLPFLNKPNKIKEQLRDVENLLFNTNEQRSESQERQKNSRESNIQTSVNAIWISDCLILIIL